MAGPLFISYSHRDRRVVSDVAARLRRKGYTIWLDREQLAPDSDVSMLRANLSSAMQSSGAVLSCLSKRMLSDWGWVHFELAMATETTPIVVLRLDDCNIPSNLEVYPVIDWNDGRGIERLIRWLATFRELERSWFAAIRDALKRSLASPGDDDFRWTGGGLTGAVGPLVLQVEDVSLDFLGTTTGTWIRRYEKEPSKRKLLADLRADHPYFALDEAARASAMSCFIHDALTPGVRARLSTSPWAASWAEVLRKSGLFALQSFRRQKTASVRLSSGATMVLIAYPPGANEREPPWRDALREVEACKTPAPVAIVDIMWEIDAGMPRFEITMTVVPDDLRDATDDSVVSELTSAFREELHVWSDRLEQRVATVDPEARAKLRFMFRRHVEQMVARGVPVADGFTQALEDEFVRVAADKLAQSLEDGEMHSSAFSAGDLEKSVRNRCCVVVLTFAADERGALEKLLSFGGTLRAMIEWRERIDQAPAFARHGGVAFVFVGGDSSGPTWLNVGAIPLPNAESFGFLLPGGLLSDEELQLADALLGHTDERSR